MNQGKNEFQKNPHRAAGKIISSRAGMKISGPDHPMKFFQTAGSLAWFGHDGESLGR
jgi:hypothetical protein